MRRKQVFKKVMMAEEWKMTFDEWFMSLVEYSMLLNSEDLIDMYNKDSYREYYEDGDSPEEVFAQEADAKFSRIH